MRCLAADSVVDDILADLFGDPKLVRADFCAIERHGRNTLKVAFWQIETDDQALRGLDLDLHDRATYVPVASAGEQPFLHPSGQLLSTDVENVSSGAPVLLPILPVEG